MFTYSGAANTMPLTIEAIYENGLLRPIQPLPLKEQERVQLTIHAATNHNWVSETAGMIKWTGDHATLRLWPRMSSLTRTRRHDLRRPSRRRGELVGWR